MACKFYLFFDRYKFINLYCVSQLNVLGISIRCNIYIFLTITTTKHCGIAPVMGTPNQHLILYKTQDHYASLKYLESQYFRT